MTEHTLRAGAAEVDITPPMGVQLCGYGPNLKRVCTDVLDPLYARALWIETKDCAVAIIAVDLCTVEMNIHQAVSAELGKACDLDAHNLMICASHTHSGPATQPMNAWGDGDPDYLDKLPHLLAQAVMGARNAAEPATTGACRVRVDGVGVNREQFFGPTDTAAQLMRVNRADGTAIAVVYNFGAHAVIRYPFTSRVSADWPGLVAACIKSQLPGAIPLFMQGPCGNTNAHEMSFARDDSETRQKISDMRVGDVAKRFSDQVLPALEVLDTSPTDTVKSVWEMIELPCVRPDRAELEETIREHLPVADSMTLDSLPPLHENLTSETAAQGEWREARWEVDGARGQIELLEDSSYVCEAPIQVLQIGEAVLVAWPGEIYVELGIELRQRSPFPLTFVSSCANHMTGYIPTPAVYESKGRGNDFGRYPRGITPAIYEHLPFREDVGRVLLETTLSMLNNLQ